MLLENWATKHAQNHQIKSPQNRGHMGEIIVIRRRRKDTYYAERSGRICITLFSPTKKEPAAHRGTESDQPQA